MRLDSANRSFLLLTGVALLLGMYVLWGAIGTVSCTLLSRASPTGDLVKLFGSAGSLAPGPPPSSPNVSRARTAEKQ